MASEQVRADFVGKVLLPKVNGILLLRRITPVCSILDRTNFRSDMFFRMKLLKVVPALIVILVVAVLSLKRGTLFVP
jgi:hypothetical protein